MTWRSRKQEMQEKAAQAQAAVQKAQEGVITAQVGYMGMLDLQRMAVRIADTHQRLQRENGFGYRVFGVEK